MQTVCSLVTGVQTCALPIYAASLISSLGFSVPRFWLATALVSGAPVRGLTHSICVPLRGLPVRPVLSSNTVWIDAGSAGSAKLCQLRMHPADRKGVGTGKSGAVRVDLGGRRIIKKKKEK